MTLGWHMMTDYSAVATYIWDANHSFEMIRRSKACVINVPTFDLIDTVVAIGNCTGADADKFEQFGLTPVAASHVDAPMIGECVASFECDLEDASLVNKRGVFFWRVVAAHTAPTVKNPKTIHYRGQGEFMTAGPVVSRRSKFKPGNL
jgi:flavin reductase (DIM6/NTAB) family NADH-FMN oxidoreductase RutF